MDGERLRHLLHEAASESPPAGGGARRVIERTDQEGLTSQRLTPPLWPRRRLLRIGGACAAAVVLVAALGLAVSSSHRPDSSSSSSPSSSSAGSSTDGTLSLPTAAAGVGKSGSTSAQVPARAARVVQTGQVSLEVARGKVQPTLDRLSAIATGVGGYLSESRIDSGADTPSGTSTLRVPVASFSSVLGQVRHIGKVTSTSTQARDVTAEYVDLGARINALTQTRATFLTLLSKATTIGDTLAVQQQIQPVQTQIEQLQGQQKLLADTSDLATLAVSVAQTGGASPAPATHHRSGFSKAFHDAVHGFNTGLQALITVAGPLLLAVLVLGALGLLSLLGYRRLRRRYV